MVTVTEVALSPDRRRVWLRRVGALGFCFFLVKGLAWLAVPLLFWLGVMG
jgi:hypothetical protein